MSAPRGTCALILADARRILIGACNLTVWCVLFGALFFLLFFQGTLNMIVRRYVRRKGQIGFHKDRFSVCGNFDISFVSFPTYHQLFTTLHTPYGVLYLGTMALGC